MPEENVILQMLFLYGAAWSMVLSALWVWFKTSWPNELLLALRWWYEHDRPEWLKVFDRYTDTELAAKNRDELVVAMCVAVTEGKFPRRLLHVLGCPGCLSVWLSFFATVLMLLLWVPSWGVGDCMAFTVTCWLSIPGTVNWVFSRK